ncbi:hypothetical protein SUGI_0893000 [Cryptomeria japonica]|nr:hypothetical protein SUGI_0893000 [Cryptomeria japonica]
MHDGNNVGARNADGRNALENEGLRALHRHIDALQEELRRGFNPRRGESDDEGEVEYSSSSGSEEAIDHDQVQLLRAISQIEKRPEFEVSNYSGNLNPEEMIDWINELDEYFEYEEI